MNSSREMVVSLTGPRAIMNFSSSTCYEDSFAEVHELTERTLIGGEVEPMVMAECIVHY